VASNKNSHFNLNVGPAAVAATGIAGFALLIVLLFGFLALGGFITMILLGVLHAEVALGIPAFGYWASFWLTLGWAWAASFFRSYSK
jgi:hypothetical protein